MRKLILGAQSAVIFFEPDEAFWLDGIERGRCSGESARKLLHCTGIDLPEGALSLELFERDGHRVLFITASGEPESAQTLLFRFSCADDLMDAAAALGAHGDGDEHSELYFLSGAYYMLFYPPLAVHSERLTEFSEQEPGPPGRIAYIKEYGELLSSPGAFSELSRRLRQART